MVDLDQQIAAWVDAETDGVDPVTVDEAITRGASPASRRTVARRPLAIGLAAAAVLVGALAVVVVRDDRSEDSVHAGPGTATTRPQEGDDWKTSTVPDLGWTVDRPISSTFQSWQSRCNIADTGALITISPQRRPVAWEPIDNGCTTAWSTKDLAQPGFVALQISHYSGGPYVPPDGGLESTPPGLTLGDLQPEADGDTSVTGPGGLRILRTSVVVGGDSRYSVTAWIASDAPASLLADLRRMVRSIRWDSADESTGSIGANASGNPRTSTFTACMRDRGYDAEMALDERSHIDGEVGAVVVWGAGDQRRATYADDHKACSAAGNSAAGRLNREFAAWPPHEGPSQTPAAAERDGVVPEVAELPLGERGISSRYVDTDEGTWAITRSADRFGGAGDADGCLGDRSGRYGIDFACSGEYSEVVLVDPDDGRLLRAYPFPGLPLTWMRVEPDAVYAGRVGDGGAPDSVIVRIDRETLEAQAVLFPNDDPAGPNPDGDPATDLGLLDPAAMGWTVATPDQQAQRLVGGQDLPGGLLVDASIGLTMIDRPAVEELFA